MAEKDPRQKHLDHLREWRNKPERAKMLGDFLPGQFKREIEKPYKQLATIAPVWMELVPAELAAHTRLESFSKGVLRVVVDSSSRLYELDRLLREGLQERIITAHKGPAFRKVQLKVGAVAGGAADNT
ncbi:MAG: DUF721 domain-containing protein [Planctomycetes bacterium]|nr:DUF721 domain-containing protein [Planctomycetota bacterium]